MDVITRARIGRVGILVSSLIWLVASVSFASQVHARAADTDLAARAQPLGKPLDLILGFGEQFEYGDQLYDAKVAVVKVLRGGPAEALVKSASASNPPAKAGLEYLAAKIHFEFTARVVLARYDYTLDSSQFTSISADGAAYPTPDLVAQPNPALHAAVRSGHSFEGWVVLLVPRSDRTPLMLFVPDADTTSHQGGSPVFRLYGAASLGSGSKSS